MATQSGNLESLDATLKRFDKTIERVYGRKPLPELQDVLGLYRMTRHSLTFPQLQNWKVYLLAFSFAHFAGHFYLFYRQYRALQRPDRPKVLSNVLTDSEFAARRSHQLSLVKFRFFRDLWKLVFTSLLIALDVLPMLWLKLDMLVWNTVSFDPIAYPYEQTFGHSIFFPLFYLACALIWTILMAPGTYYGKCILGTGPPKGEKQTSRQWIRGVLWEQFNYFWRIWVMIFLEEGQMDLRNNANHAFHGIFNAIQDLAGVFTAYYLFVRPLIPARFMNLTPLRPGKTKSAIEALAKELAFPLGEVYTCRRKDDGEATISISGWFGKKSISMTSDTLDKCNTEDIVALIAVEMGSWRHNPFQQLAFKGLAFVLYITPVWILHFNWPNITRSLGFKQPFVEAAQHPFQILVLIYGGVLDSVFHPTDAFMSEIARYIETSADKLAVKRGYGIPLARTLIKLKKGKVEMPVADPAYFKAFPEGYDPLSKVLKNLGWTGDEELEEEKGKLNDHWEMME